MKRTIDIDVGEHKSDLVKNLNNARKEERLCDVTIKVGSRNIPCHKIVLSEGCDFFRGMFAHRMKENESGVAEMKDVDPECMMMCIEYIYTGRVSIPGGKVLELLQAADMLQLTKLYDKIVFCLGNGLDAESFFATRKIANTLNLRILEETCNEFAMKNFEYIAAMDEFKNLEKKCVTLLIRSKETKVSESVKCKALLVWSYADLESRTKTFERTFLSLNFSNMPKEYLSHLVKNEELVFNSTSCLRRLMRNISDKSNAASRDVNLIGGEQDLSVNAIAVFETESVTLQVLNIKEKTWNVAKDLSSDFVRKVFTAVVVENDIYVLAHDKSNYRLRYVVPGASWVQMPDRIRTTEVAAVVFDGEIYAFDYQYKDSRSIEKFDVTRTSWTNVCARRDRRCESVVVEAGGFIYCIGGYVGYDNNASNDVTRFEPRSGTWTEMPPMPSPRYRAAAVHLDAKIYVVGGSSGWGSQTTNECFDTMTRTWTSLALLMNPRLCSRVCLVQGKIYAVGGCSYDSENAIEEYDPSTDKWKIFKTMTGKDIQQNASVALRL